MAVSPGAGQINRPKALCRWALAVLDVIAGRPADAVTRLASIADMTTGNGQVVIQVMATPWLAEAAARSGEHTAATGNVRQGRRKRTVIIDDSTDGLPIGNKCIGCAREVDDEGFVELQSRVPINRHGNGLGRLAWVEG